MGGRGTGSRANSVRSTGKLVAANENGEAIAPQSEWNKFADRVSEDYGSVEDAAYSLREFADDYEDDDPVFAELLIGLATRIENGTASKADLKEAWEQLNPR